MVRTLWYFIIDKTDFLSCVVVIDYDDQFSPTSFTLMSGVSNQLCVKVDIIDDSEIESFTEEENFFITMNISPLLLDRITLMPATAEVLITDNDGKVGTVKQE